MLPDGRRVRLGEHTTVLGRNSDCTVTLADPRASRRHAEIRATADGFVVVDLGSMNGTMVNGVPVQGARAARRRRDRGRRDRDALRGLVVPESVLTILKFCFLALLYLFLFRVVRVVMAEMRAPAPAPPQPRRRPAAPKPADAAPRRGPRRRRSSASSSRRPGGARRSRCTDELTVGRGGGCGIVLDDDRSCRRCTRASSGATATSTSKTSVRATARCVNGEPVGTRAQLRRGDQVQFGQTVAEARRAVTWRSR